MKFITPAQCRAARSLLNWTQPDLFEKSGVHVQTISAFEKEEASPTKRTLAKLLKAFEAEGLEFFDNDGLQRKSTDIVTYTGQDGFSKFIWDVYETAKNTPNHDICVCNVDERDFIKWEGKDAQPYQDAMAELGNVQSRILICEGDTFFSADSYATYRWAPKTQFGDISYYIYGHKTALISFSDNDVVVYVIENGNITEFFRSLFEQSWDNAKPIIA